MKRLTRTALLIFMTLVGPARADTADARPAVVPFELLATKHMVVMVKINGKGPYRVIFDTGAPVTLLNTKVARETGLLAKDAPKPLFALMAAGQGTIKTLEVGELKAKDVPAIIMDHPTVELAAQFLGPLEGIIGFPLFARYRMTLDYQAKQMTFVPNGYRPPDVVQAMMESLFNFAADDAPKVVAPAGLWGLVVVKDAGDEEAGVRLQEVLSGGAAERAGLKRGDRLLTIDGRWTDTVADCFRAAAAVPPGTGVKVAVKRDGKELELMVNPRPGL